jgi:hypothetical protein
MFATKRIRLSHYGPTPAHLFSDFIWLQTQESRLLADYGECSIIVYQQQVLGVGRTVEESLADAEAHLPAEIGVITAIQKWLVARQPLMRIQPIPPADRDTSG